LQGFLAVQAMGQYLEVGLPVQEVPQAIEDEGVVVS